MPTTLTEYLNRLNGPEGQNSSRRDEIVTALLADFPDFGDRSSLYQAGGPDRDHRQESKERLRRVRPVCWSCVRQVWSFKIGYDGIPICTDCLVRGPGAPPSTPTGISYLDHSRILRNHGEIERSEIFEYLAMTTATQGSY